MLKINQTFLFILLLIYDIFIFIHFETVRYVFCDLLSTVGLHAVATAVQRVQFFENAIENCLS